MQRQDRSFINTPFGAKQLQPSVSPRITPTPETGAKGSLHPAFTALPIALFVAALGADILAWWMSNTFWAESALRLTAVGAVVAILFSLHTYLQTPTDAASATWQSNLSQFAIPALAIVSLLVRFVDLTVGAVIPWGLVLSTVISILLLTRD